jgi:hypothetical protein
VSVFISYDFYYGVQVLCQRELEYFKSFSILLIGLMAHFLFTRGLKTKEQELKNSMFNHIDRQDVDSILRVLKPVETQE